jgi:hypothetical protein
MNNLSKTTPIFIADYTSIIFTNSNLEDFKSAIEIGFKWFKANGLS